MFKYDSFTNADYQKFVVQGTHCQQKEENTNQEGEDGEDKTESNQEEIQGSKDQEEKQPPILDYEFVMPECLQ